MTFVWTKATQKYLASAWKSLIEICEKLNAWLASNGFPERVSVLRKPDPSYLLELDALFAQLEERAAVKIVTEKGTENILFRNCTMILRRYLSGCFDMPSTKIR